MAHDPITSSAITAQVKAIVALRRNPQPFEQETHASGLISMSSPRAVSAPSQRVAASRTAMKPATAAAIPSTGRPRAAATASAPRSSATRARPQPDEDEDATTILRQGPHGDPEQAQVERAERSPPPKRP